jgi:peptidyl-prolyl cis-trans isomerase B (cyclophilin B)
MAANSRRGSSRGSGAARAGGSDRSSGASGRAGGGSRGAARARVARQLASRGEQAALRRRRRAAVIGAAAAAVLLVAAGVWWLARPSGGKPAATASAAPTSEGPCDWSVIPANARSKDMRDVGTPPAGGEPRTGSATMTITTNLGVVKVQIDRARVPCAAASFAYLAGRHFFDSSPCHRLVDKGLHALQCGDPAGTGWGGPPYRYADENLPTGKRPAYPKGTAALANAGENTNQSQFFLVYADSDTQPSLPVLGRITEGLEIIEQVAAAGHDNGFATNPDGTQGPGGGHPTKPVTIISLTVD